MVDALRARELPADVLPMFPGARPSAVLVALRDGPQGAEVLLTRRSMNLRNHRGEISFPGGRLDEGETYEEAALREAAEEVAMPPSSVDVVGRLLPLSTVVSLSYIVPVVGVLRDDPPLHAATGEVDRLFWEPLADLLVDGTYREERWGTPPLDRPIYFFELDDETVWGATARMLHQLLRVAHRITGPEPDAL
ncbi:MAG: CoA pyrophosphatase [Ilumatobacteraceae bacterium]